MANSKSKRKQVGVQNDAASKKLKTSAVITPPPDQSAIAEPKTIQSIGLNEDDLDIAIDTLNTLTENPSVIKSKACKDLRTAVYEFRQACTTGFNASVDTNLTARISGALADEGYNDARILLAEMRIRGNKPKLGALCRWARDIDAVSGLAEQVDGGAKRTAREEDLLVVLDAILRLTGPVDYTTDGQLAAGPMIPRKEWDLRDGKTRRPVYDSVLDRSIFTSFHTNIKSGFRIIETTPGLQRKPPNLHPTILHASKDDTILVSPNPQKSSHYTHPIVPNLHLLKDILSPEECTWIIAAAETIGFTPDAPVRAEGEESSILAHNFYWIVDEVFCGKLWEELKHLCRRKLEERR